MATVGNEKSDSENIRVQRTTFITINSVKCNKKMTNEENFFISDSLRVLIMDYIDQMGNFQYHMLSNQILNSVG